MRRNPKQQRKLFLLGTLKHTAPWTPETRKDAQGPDPQSPKPSSPRKLLIPKPSRAPNLQIWALVGGSGFWSVLYYDYSNEPCRTILATIPTSKAILALFQKPRALIISAIIVTMNPNPEILNPTCLTLLGGSLVVIRILSKVTLLKIPIKGLIPHLKLP